MWGERSQTCREWPTTPSTTEWLNWLHTLTPVTARFSGVDHQYIIRMYVRCNIIYRHPHNYQDNKFEYGTPLERPYLEAYYVY